MVHRALIPHHQPPIVIHPPKAAFHLPTVTVVGARADRPPALGPLPGPPHKRGNRGLDAPAAQIAAELLAVIGFIRHQLLGACPRAASRARYSHSGQSGRRQSAVVRPGTVHMQPDRQALAIGNDHHLRALADFGLADAAPPCFAGTKLPSRKAWAHSSWLWASSRLRSARHTRSQVPSCDPACRRRQQVVGAPYSRGTSSQAPPVLSTCTMPLTVRRSSARRRPGPGFGVGSSGAMMVHWSSVSPCRLMPTVSRGHTEF
jgi:hypothetical protein